MKVRIQANTLRFRLRQQDISQFQQNGKVTEIIEFGPDPANQLRFCLEISSEPELTVSFEANTATVLVPRHLAEEWVSTDLVGFDGKAATGMGRLIEVLVEKDFMCLNAPEEDKVDAFPNPKAVC